MNVTLIGDSLTVGIYPFFKALSPSALVVAKVGADITWMYKQAKPRAGDTVVVLGGTNDLMGVSPEEVFKRLKWIYEELIAEGFAVRLALLPPHKTRSSERYKLNQFIRDSGLPYLTFGSSDGDVLMSADGIHPTAEGSKRIAEKWFAELHGDRQPIERSSSSAAPIAIAAALGVVAVFAFNRK